MVGALMLPNSLGGRGSFFVPRERCARCQRCMGSSDYQYLSQQLRSCRPCYSVGSSGARSYSAVHCCWLCCLCLVTLQVGHHVSQHHSDGWCRGKYNMHNRHSISTQQPVADARAWDQLVPPQLDSSCLNTAWHPGCHAHSYCMYR